MLVCRLETGHHGFGSQHSRCGNSQHGTAELHEPSLLSYLHVQKQINTQTWQCSESYHFVSCVMSYVYMYTDKSVNCICSTNLICQFSSQVMAILATHNHDNISFISPHMLKLSVARAVLVMEPEGGVSPVIIIICFTSTLSLSHYSMCAGCLATGGSELFKICLFEFPPFVFVIDY